MRTLLLFFLLCLLAFDASAQQAQVAPIVGQWDYGENRCGVNLFGYPSEDAAAVGGAHRFYVTTNRCAWSYEPRTAWGTPQNRTNGACGSTNYYPRYTLGVESFNTRHYTIHYRFGNSCQYSAGDGLTVYRKRGVGCPAGYSNYGNRCVRASTTPDPNKENDCCQAGSNGTNPIQGATGAKLQHEVDIDFGGGLVFERFYSSSRYWGPTVMGQHWRHGWDASISLSDASAGGGPVTAWARRPNGNMFAFNRTPDGAWQGEPDVTLRLSRLVSAGTPVGWSLHDGQRVETYDVDGRLTEIETPEDGRLLLAYDAGRLQSIMNRYGRSIVFRYDASNRLSGFTGPDGGEYSYAYDTAGNLSGVGYPHAASGPAPARGYRYEDARFPHALTAIVDETGAIYASWAYDAGGRAVTSAHGDPAAPADHFSLAFNSNGTVSITDPLGKRRDYGFATSHGVRRQASLSEPCWGCNGAPARTRTYDANGFADKVTSFSGVVTDYDYDAQGLLVQKIEAANDADARRTTQTTWDANLRAPTARTLHDAAGTMVSRHEWTYDARGQVASASVVDPQAGRRRTTSTSFCEQADVDAGACPIVGLVTAIDGPRTDVVDITSYVYYPSDDPGCATGPATCMHRKGDLWKITDAMGHVTETLAYDGAGRVLSMKDANGVVTDYAYARRGWLAARTMRGDDDASDADDATTRFEYTPFGMVARIADPEGVVTNFQYDQAHRLVGVSDASGNRLRYLLDPAGHRVKEDTFDATGSLVRTLSRVYDQLGQLRTIADAQANPTDFTYDAAGNADTTTDAYGRVSELDYDPFGRLKRSLQDVGGIGAQTDFQYDAQDRLVRVTDPKRLATEYGYDAFGDLVRQASPDSGLTTYAYDSAGNRVGSRDARGVEAAYAYDALGRLVHIDYGDPAANVSYHYDTAPASCVSSGSFASGRVSEILDGSGSTDYCYDRAGRPILKQRTTHGLVLGVRYAYDSAGRLSAVEYPGGTRVAYERDALGQVSAVMVVIGGGTAQTLLGSVSHHPFGPPSALIYGDGRTLHRLLDANYRPVRIEDPAAGGLSLDFEFDAVGNLRNVATADGMTPLAGYEYDGLGRLAAVMDGPTGTPIERYAYDATGNRLGVANAGTETTYGYAADSHRLMNIGVVSRDYDAAGNTTRIGADTLAYGAANRLVRYLRDGEVLADYAYDGKGQQVWWREVLPCEKAHGNSNGTGKPDKVGKGGSHGNDGSNGKNEERCAKEKGSSHSYSSLQEVFAVYDEAGHLLGTYDADGAARQEVIWLEDLPVGVIDGSGATASLAYVEADHLGTPRVVIEPAAQQAVWTWALQGEAFGATPPNEDPDQDGIGFHLDLRFPGQRHDQASGLNYNMRRDYESALGRYTQPDPIGLGGGLSLFGYVEQNPLISVDPRGLVKIYGFWCGPDWTGGFEKAWNSLSPREKMHVENPADQLDVSCKQHDLCYGKCGKDYPCDKKLRGMCFRDCDYKLTRDAYVIGGFLGMTIGAAIDRPGDRDPGPNAPNCSNCRSAP